MIKGWVSFDDTLTKKCKEASDAGGSQSPSFRICMEYTQNQKGCNVQISLLSSCHKPLNNSTWCNRGLLLIHDFLNSWQSHQQNHCHCEIVQAQAQMQFSKTLLSICFLSKTISYKNMLVYIFQDSEQSPPPACYPGRLYDGTVTMETVDKLKMFSLL